ncbi:MAG: hypothetical protein HPY85_06500 [Anaerolineae bacterium]|nr:hypothetical protein [Anaerolineae bacterium]
MSAPLLFGPYGAGALAHIDRFHTAGANALWFHGFDKRAFTQCQAKGIHACVEFKTFRADFDTHPELIPIGADGKPIRYGSLVQGVCLSQSDFLAETEQHLLDGLETYAPAGIWLDYLTYAGWFETPEPDLQESCFCPACIAEFCQSTGIDADTPREILGHHQQAWTRHKCERVAGFAARYAGLIRSLRPGTIIGAYMCPWLPEEYNGALRRIFAQEYGLLAPSIDVFTPLIYAHKSGRPMDWGRTFLEASPAFIPPGSKVQLILDILDYPDSLEQTARSAVPTWGVQVFGGAGIFESPGSVRTFREAVEAIRKQFTE